MNTQRKQRNHGVRAFLMVAVMPAAMLLSGDTPGAAQLVRTDVIGRYEASLRALRRVRFRVQQRKYFVGGPFKEETKTLDVDRYCVRDEGRWEFSKRQWELTRIRGKFREVRVEEQDVCTEAGWVTVWVHPPGHKREHEEFKVHARLASEAPPARTDADALEDCGDSDAYAWVPWPLELGEGALVFGYVSMDGTARLSKVLENSQPQIAEDAIPDGSARRAMRVESRGKYGRHRVWFDPASGFLPRRVEVEKISADIFGAVTVAELGPHKFKDSLWPDLAVEKVVILISDVEIAKIGENFVTTGFKYTLTRHHPGGVVASERTEIRVTDVDLKPTYKETDFKITVPVPNGTNVLMRGVPQIVYEWRDGEVVKSVDQSAAEALAGQTFVAGEAAVWKIWLLVSATLVGSLLLTVAIWSRRRSRSRTSPGS